MPPSIARSLWAVSLALVLASSCGAGRRPAGRPSVDLERLLPDATAVNPWHAAEGPVEYGPGNLYEYLDGGAERYVGHGFQRLVHVRYQLGDREANSVVLDLFDMGSELGAFGIYSNIRPLEATFRRWGAEGYRSGSIAAAWKGRLFVHAEADSENVPVTELLERVVRGACERVGGSGAPPAVLAALPVEGLVPRSERVVAADLLGHDCLPGGVLAAYAVGDTRAELYFSDLANERRAAFAFGELRAHHERSAGRLGESLVAGVRGFSFHDPIVGDGAVIITGRFVAGIHGTLPRSAQMRLLASLAARLASLAPEPTSAN